MECWDEEWEDEAPVGAENAAKCNEFRRAKRARLAVAVQASKRALARQLTFSQGSSRDSNQPAVSKRGSSMYHRHVSKAVDSEMRGLERERTTTKAATVARMVPCLLQHGSNCPLQLLHDSRHL